MGLASSVRSWSKRRGLWIALVATLVLPRWAAAQGDPLADEQPAERRSSFDVSAMIGILTPLSSLSSVDITGIDTTVVARSDLSATVAFVAELDYFLPGGFGVGVQGAYAHPDVSAQIVDTTAVPPGFQDLGTADFWTVSGNVMYRPAFSGPTAVVTPYGALGAGVRILSFSRDGTAGLSNTTDFLGTAALGALVELADWIDLRGEVRYNLSPYESGLTGDSKLQSDFVVGVGATAHIGK
jgi:hypothetical protein